MCLCYYSVTGRRTCVGEPLAKMELLMFVCSVLQHYALRQSTTLPDISEAKFGLTLKLPQFDITANKL